MKKKTTKISKVVFDEVVHDSKGRNWKIWPIIRDIRRILNQIPEKQVQVIRRNANIAADWVASEAIKGMCNIGWVRQPPSSLMYILDKDGLAAPHSSS